MGAMVSVLLAALFFAGVHLGVAGTQQRDHAVVALGTVGYQITFSLASVAGLAWMVLAYKHAPHLATWGTPEWCKPFAVLLMLPAFLLAVIGVTTPNPTAIAQEGSVSQPPQGIVRITRHPFLMGVAIWALVHVIANGDVASLVFFGTWAIVALAGTLSIDAKRRRLQGVAWKAFAAETSIMPFGAILAGRNHISWREIGLWRIAAALVAYTLMLAGHSHIIGVSPFPG
jgi:uncharacterized membrane protein